MSNIIGVVFDFDDTLTPDTTTLLLNKFGVDANDFWKKKYKKLISSGFDSTLAYLKLLLELIGPNKPLGLLNNNDLRNFGESLDGLFYPGIPAIFEDLKNAVNKAGHQIIIEFYIISGGLNSIIKGSKIVQKYFTACYCCELYEDGNPPMLSGIKRSINFTEKTRCLYEINKGIRYNKSLKNPFQVNEYIPKDKKRIPFENIIYIGDGLTDIPCFSMMKQYQGTSFGVFNPEDQNKAKTALIKYLKPERVMSMHAPNYMKNRELGSFIRAQVAAICSNIILKQKKVYPYL